jgi:hypothetical protein
MRLYTRSTKCGTLGTPTNHWARVGTHWEQKLGTLGTTFIRPCDSAILDGYLDVRGTAPSPAPAGTALRGVYLSVSIVPAAY